MNSVLQYVPDEQHVRRNINYRIILENSRGAINYQEDKLIEQFCSELQRSGMSVEETKMTELITASSRGATY